jgi:hypothetical protein
MVISITWHLGLLPHPKKLHQAPTNADPAGTQPPPKPQMFHFNHAPTTPEEKAIMDWWRYMDTVDPKFQWKTPLAFYGLVIDQHGLPVSGATAYLAWNDISGSHEKSLRSAIDGKFELTHVIGKRLSVEVAKAGYAGKGSETNRSFEYAAFFEPNFHVPNRETPVVFKLWKLENAQPMYFWNKVKRLSVAGQKVWFDTNTGAFGSAGDVAFSTVRGAVYGPRRFDWSVTVDAAPNGGVLLSTEDLMFEAPPSGYQRSWTQEVTAAKEPYSISKALKFYLKTPSGKYAAIEARITHMQRPEAEVTLYAYVNPDGSRNLQYDPEQRISPK